MGLAEEDRALNALLYSDLADALPYLGLNHFVSLFPARAGAAKYVQSFLDANNKLPTHKQVRRKHPDLFVKPERAEALKYCFEVLTEELADAVVQDTSEEMAKKFKANDIEGFLELSQQMVDNVSLIRQPIHLSGINVDDHNKQRLANVQKDAALALKCIATGFAPMDEALGGGAAPSMLIVLAALINLGKTYAVCQIAEHMRSNGNVVVLVPLEMSGEDIAERCLCLRYNLNVDHYIKRQQPDASIAAGETREEWYERILQERQALVDKDTCKGRVIIETHEGLTNTRHIKKWVAQHEADAVIIDAAQDIQAGIKVNGRVEGLYTALAELNNISRDLAVPILMTVQMTSEVEKKGIKTGNLVNIQWSQAFAQKAHAVFTMIGDRASSMRDLTTDKNRDGQVGRAWQLGFTFPEVSVDAQYLQPVGVSVVNDSDLFDSPEDAAYSRDEMPEELTKGMTENQKDSVEVISELVAKMGGDELEEDSSEEVEEPENDAPGYTNQYDKNRTERKLKRLKRKAQRKAQS